MHVLYTLYVRILYIFFKTHFNQILLICGKDNAWHELNYQPNKCSSAIGEREVYISLLPAEFLRNRGVVMVPPIHLPAETSHVVSSGQQ